MNVKRIVEAHTLCASFVDLMRTIGIADRRVHELLVPRVCISNNQLYFSVDVDEIDVSRIDSAKAFAKMRSLAYKYVIPVPPEVSDIPTKTVVITSEGTRNVESESVARGGDYILINNPPADTVTRLDTTWTETAHLEPRERVLAMIRTAMESGWGDIYPITRNFRLAIDGVGNGCAVADRPKLVRVKSSATRAVARFPGPTIVDQTGQWGLRSDGSRNYQIQPNTVFVVHLNDSQRPLIQNGMLKANTCELKPFIEDYRSVDGQQIDSNSVSDCIPIVQFSGELSVLSGDDIRNIADAMLKFNRKLRTVE